ncbi:MAG: EAL domain-containing protein [Legionella sp.]|nr:EAL domain-containing protein [Legionella sp.]
MHQQFQQAGFTYKKFKIIWVIITVTVLLISLYINKQIYSKRIYRDLSQVASTISNNVDGLIEDLLQEVYTLPISGMKLNRCSTDLASLMEHIILNDIKISALIISKERQIICSTLPQHELVTPTSNYPRSLSGPYDFPVFDHPLYQVQQKIGNYIMAILVQSLIFENVLRTSSDLVSDVFLYNSMQNQKIIEIKQNKRHFWVPSNPGSSSIVKHSHILVVYDKLQSINGIQVGVIGNPKTIIYNLWLSQILLTFWILTFFYLLGYLLSNVFKRKYSLHGAMKSGLRNKEFYPEYQPVYDQQMKAYVGAELLLRWRDRYHQIIMPDYFIHEAEQSGIIVPITLQIAEIAFKETALIFNENPQFHLAINISSFHFIDPAFFKKLSLLMKNYHIKPHNIIFEITERDLLNKNDSIYTDKMHQLRAKGFSLAVDDYGTGHASINYLQHFPFNYLKIDKLFIQAIGTKALTESLNDAIIRMAQELSLTIIAEGVETIEQVNYLRTNKVRYLQGWFFSKALDSTQLYRLLGGEKQ